jgi:predicted secreted acid phosphatase
LEGRSSVSLHRSIAGMLLAAIGFVPFCAAAQGTQLPAPGACPVSDCTSPIASSQLQNLGQLKDEIRAYYENGSYEHEITPIEDDAAQYIDRRVTEGVKHPAIVLDIDDTALLTEGYEVAHDFGFDETSWTAYAAHGFPAVAPTVALAKHAQTLGVAVFFVTGRRTPLYDLTVKNLNFDGYIFEKLYLRPTTDHAASVVPFKSGERAAIEQAGYTILITMGDQWSDLQGGHAERAYKLPNPMYFIP